MLNPHPKQLVAREEARNYLLKKLNIDCLPVWNDKKANKQMVLEALTYEQ